LVIALLAILLAAHGDDAQSGKDIAVRLSSKTQALDLDGDGKTNVWREFDSDGRLLSIRYDNDGNGKPDEWVKFEHNREIREKDLAHTGAHDWRETKDFTGAGETRRLERVTVERREDIRWRTVEERVLSKDGSTYSVTTWDKSGKASRSKEPAAIR
jgi:hypothetical protein